MFLHSKKWYYSYDIPYFYHDVSPHVLQPRQLRGQREHRINELREELEQERQEVNAQVGHSTRLENLGYLGI